MEGARAEMGQASHPLEAESNGNETLGSCRFERYTPRQALHRGIKMAMVTLGLAVASVILPGIHFISVPLGILASPFVGAYYYRASKGVPKSMRGDFECPDCRAPNRVAAPRITAFYVARCKECQTEVRLTPR